MQHSVMTGSSSQHRSGSTPSRIRVWCDELQTSAWVLVPRTAATVSEVAVSIADKLGLANTDDEYDLFMDDALVLPSEEARLIRDGDIVAIKNKRPTGEAAQAPRKRIKMVVAPDAVMVAPQRQQMQPIPLSDEKDLEPQPRKLRQSAPEDISAHGKDPLLPYKTGEEEIGSNTKISPLNRTEIDSAPAFSHADLNLKRPFQERPSPTNSPQAGERSSKLSNRLEKDDMQATAPPAQPGPSTRKKTDVQLRSVAQVKSQVVMKPSKLPNPRAHGGPAAQGRAVSPPSSPPPKNSGLETPAPASSSGHQKPHFELPPSASPPGCTKSAVDSLSTSAAGQKKLVFEPTPRKEKPVVQKDTIQGRKPSRPSFAKAVGDNVLSKKTSTVIAGAPDLSKRPRVAGRPGNKDTPAPEAKKMSWQRPAKPTNVYTAGRSRPADRGHNESRARHASNSNLGNDSNMDMNAMVDTDRDTGRTYNSGRNREYYGGQNYNTGKDFGVDRDRRSKALQETQHNESFYVGSSSNSRKTSEEDMPPNTKSKTANKEKSSSDEADNFEIEETKKDLMELFGKSKSEKLTRPPTTHEDLPRQGPDNAATKAPFAVCENLVSKKSCTILNMLRDGPPGGSDDSGVYCRVQVLLGFGRSQKTTREPSKWISLMLAARPTQTNDLRISKVNAEALNVLRRAGRAARQRSPGTTFDRRGANLKEDLPILLNPNAIHKFSFDIRNHTTDDSTMLQAGMEEIGDAKSLWKNDQLIKESAKRSSSGTGVNEPEVKTGYENLRSRFDKPSRENMPRSLSLDQLPIIDELPVGTADLGTELDVTDYPPLEDVDSVLDTLNGIELDHVADNATAIHVAQVQPPQNQIEKEDHPSVNSKISPIPRSVPPVDGIDGVGAFPGDLRVQTSISPPRNVLSPDSVIDLVEEPRELDFAKRENSTFRSDYRNFMLNVITDVTSTLKTLTQRDDLHLRRFSSMTSLS